MPSYNPPVADYGFLLKEVFGFDDILSTLFADLDFDSELSLSVLEEAGRFCRDVLQPLNATGDEEGCTLANGIVTTPRGFPQAYRAFAAGGSGRSRGWGRSC